MCVLPVLSVFKTHVNRDSFSVHNALLLKYVETKNLAHLVLDNLLFPFLETLFKQVNLAFKVFISFCL